MSGRAATRLAWTLWALAAAATLASLVLFVLNRATLIEPANVSRELDAVGGVAFLAFPTVGAIIVARHPRHPIGWLFCVSGLGLAIFMASDEYVYYALLTKPSSVPGGDWAAWLHSWLFFPSVLLATGLLPLVFPNGRLLSPRWRRFVWLAAVATAAATVGNALSPQLDMIFFDTQAIQALPNPAGLGGTTGDVLRELARAGSRVFALIPFVGAVSVVQRYRLASGQERQQIKWLASAVALLAASAIADSLAYETSYMTLTLTNIFVGISLVALPVATGIAILRYRLYEIDRIISRTVSYTLVVGVLAAMYAGGVLLLRGLLPLEGDLAVAASTLVVAALFSPLRKRVQNRVDRRFNRSRYDARREVDRFAAGLTERVGFDEITAELRAVVQRTVQPERVGLWIRGKP